MGDRGIVSGYREDPGGTIRPELLSPRNDAALAWGLSLYRSALYAFAAALDPGSSLPPGDLRPVVHQVLDAFWCHPTRAGALAWATPTTATPQGPPPARPLARSLGHSRPQTRPAEIARGSPDHWY